MALIGFFLLAALAIGGALSVVLQRNPLYSALSLVAVFTATAVLYLFLQAPFLAVLQIMVYAGAIMVLFVFVIMLLSLRHEESGEAAGVPAGRRRVLAFILGAVLVVQTAVLSATFVLTGKRGEAGPDLGSVQTVGRALYKNYMFPFEVASILLLVAIIGAVAITRRHRGGLEGHVASEEGR